MLGWTSSSRSRDRQGKHRQPQIRGGTTPVAESEGRLKSLLLRVKEDSERASLKLDIEKTKIMASGLVTSRQAEGSSRRKQRQTSSSRAPKPPWWRETRRQLLLGRKATANLGGVLKSRNITLPTKVCLVKAMVFPVVTYSWESWTVKAEHGRIDAFRLPKVP